MKRLAISSALCALTLAVGVAAYAAGTAGTPEKAAGMTTHHHAAKMKPVDLNSASKEDLMKLPGVTDEIAEKIIAARPFKSKSELASKDIVSKDAYGKIRSHVTVKVEHASKMK